MHYRHAYHAGNFADVFKHVLLVGLLQAQNRKDKPWCYLDTHAGAGRYDLNSAAAGKTAEWEDGIGRLRGLPGAPEPLKSFLDIVGPKTTRYPGSPVFAQALMRAGVGDRLVLCEKVPEVCADLKSLMRAEIHERDGYGAHGLLPPREKRGLILIDPPFEARDEFVQVSDFLVKACTRFETGVYAVWYPLKNRHEAERFLRRCQRTIARPQLTISFENGAPGEGQMRACGLHIVNPPFQFAQGIEPALKVLTRELAQGPRAAYTLVAHDQDPPRR